MATASTIATQSVLRKFWDSPAGPKTIHFWAPAMKWVITDTFFFKTDSLKILTILCFIQALVFAGIGDLQRPAENLSLTQNFCNGTSVLL
jgi:long-chain acyl-CoA synthetase